MIKKFYWFVLAQDCFKRKNKEKKNEKWKRLLMKKMILCYVQYHQIIKNRKK